MSLKTKVMRAAAAALVVVPALAAGAKKLTTAGHTIFDTTSTESAAEAKKHGPDLRPWNQSSPVVNLSLTHGGKTDTFEVTADGAHHVHRALQNKR